MPGSSRIRERSYVMLQAALSYCTYCVVLLSDDTHVSVELDQLQGWGIFGLESTNPNSEPDFVTPTSLGSTPGEGHEAPATWRN